MEQQEQVGRVGIEDVRAAVEQLGGDPSKTNAARVREILGRGGFTTIQKHLERLRAEQAAPDVEDGPETAPEAPRELLQGIWQAAWAEAARRQEKALADALRCIDELEGRLSVATEDLEGLAAEMDRLQSERDEALAKAEASIKELEQMRQEMAGKQAALDAMMARLEAILSPLEN